MILKPPITTLLLPGLDGTGTLFDVFCRHCPPGFETRVISYPPDRYLGYRELIEQVRGQLPRGNPFILLGESFSGPLSILLAAGNPPGLKALVLSATFAAPPRTPWLFRLPWNLLFRLPAPAWLIRRILTGSNPDPALIAKIYAIARSVKPAVLAHRIREVARTDVTRELQDCRVPILCLQAAQDRLLSPDTADIIRRHAPHVVIARVAAPHMLLQSAPEECWRQVVQFLDMNGVASFRAIRA